MMYGVLYFGYLQNFATYMVRCTSGTYLQYLAMVCGSLKRPPRKSDHCRCSRRLWVRGTSQTKRCRRPHLYHQKVRSWILKFRLWTLEILPWSRSCRASVEHLPNVDWLVSMVFEVLQAVGQSLWAENIWEKGFVARFFFWTILTWGRVVKLPPMSLNQDSRSVTWVVSGLLGKLN